MGRLIRLQAALACTAMLGACMGQATYGYRYELKQEFGGDEEPEAANVEARQLLSAAKVVAFYPPDDCVNADPAQGAKRLQELRASCGVLMSKLERGAQSAGYEVVSWQNLRSSEGKRAIDYAREANVEVLFEVNQFEVVSLEDTTVQRTLRFFDVEDGIEKPLVVSDQVADTCRRYRGGMHQKVAWTGAIDIKTVQVVDGRDRWHYRKTQERGMNVTYPRVLFSVQKKRHPVERLATTLGVLSATAIIDLIILEQLLEDNPSTPEDEAFHASPWQYVAALASVGFFTGTYFAHKNLAVVPDASEVLCNDKYARPDPVVLKAANYSAQHEFTETSVGDSETTMRRDIGGKMIDEFIGVLREVRGPNR